MKVCSLCGKEAITDKHFSRKATCTKCGGDLYICLNCKFYSESSHNKCLETKAEFQRTRDKANFCDYFIFKDTTSSPSGKDKQEALKKLEDLFKNF